MFKVEKKFERSKNFTEREKAKFINILDKYRHILIENKATNAVAVTQKEEAWKEVTIKYNATSEVVRTTKQLRNLWLNMRRLARSNNAEHIIKPSEEREYTMEVSVESVSDLEDIMKQFKKEDTNDEDEMGDTGEQCQSTPTQIDAGTQVCMLGNRRMGTNTHLSNTCDAATYCDNVSDSDNASVAEESEGDINFVEVNLVESDTELTSCEFTHKHNNIKTKKNNTRKKLNSTFVLKKKYYQTKYATALIERKTKMVEYKNAIKKQALLNYEINLKKKEYQKLMSSNS